jgi:hypothetical protein
VERVGLERRSPQGDEPERAPAAPQPLPRAAADVLALQRTAGNHAIAQLLSHAPQAAVQRQLDDEFPHGGQPNAAELRIAKAFAKIVSDLVDAAHADLMAGRLSEWKGAKIATFLSLLKRGSPMAVTHAGNAIEERVYALMTDAALPCEWTPQFAEAMGGASKPDIVAHVSDEHDALIDVTSDRFHILGKAGGWTTSERYVYVAEAFFPSVVTDHLPHILKALDEGGIDDKAVRKLQKQVELERKQRAKARERKHKEARTLYSRYKSVQAFADGEFDGDRTEAEQWMRDNGLGSMKGVKKRKGPRKMSPEAKAKAKAKASAMAYKLKQQAKRDAEVERQKQARGKKFAKNRTAVVEEEPEEEFEDEEEEYDEEQEDENDEMLGVEGHENEDENEDDDDEEEEYDDSEEMADTY